MVTFQVSQLVGAEVETRIQAFWFHSTSMIPSFFHSSAHLSAFKVKFAINNVYSEQHQKVTYTETGLLPSTGMLFYSLLQGWHLSIFQVPVPRLPSRDFCDSPLKRSFPLPYHTQLCFITVSCLFPLQYLLRLYNYLVVCLFTCYLSPPWHSRLHEGRKLTALPSAPIAVSDT